MRQVPVVKNNQVAAHRLSVGNLLISTAMTHVRPKKWGSKTPTEQITMARWIGGHKVVRLADNRVFWIQLTNEIARIDWKHLRKAKAQPYPRRGSKNHLKITWPPIWNDRAGAISHCTEGTEPATLGSNRGERVCNVLTTTSSGPRSSEFPQNDHEPNIFHSVKKQAHCIDQRRHPSRVNSLGRDSGFWQPLSVKEDAIDIYFPATFDPPQYRSQEELGSI